MALDLEKIDLGSFGINETDEQSQLNANVSEAIKINPDQHAEVTKLSKVSGVPEFAVESNPDDVKHRLQLDKIDLDTLSQRAPRTSDFIANDFNNAVIAQDDLASGVMEGIEHTFRGLGESIKLGFKTQERGMFLAGADKMSTRIQDLVPESALPIGMGSLAADISEEYAANFGIENDEQLAQAKQEASDKLIAEIQQFQSRRQEITPDDLNLLQEGVRAGVESLANMAPGFGLMLLSGGRAAPLLATMGTQTFAGSYGESRADGLTSEEAQWYAMIDASIEVGTELLPTGTLETILTGKSKGLKKDAIKFMVREMGTEQLATLGQTINAYAFGLDEELENAQTVEEMVNIQMRRQAITAIATVVAGGAQVTAATGVRKTIEKLTQTEQEQQTQEEVGQNSIDQINKYSQESKLKERDVESFKQFIRESDGDNNTTVYIDGVQTSLYLQGKTRDEIESDPALKTLDNGLRDARQTGTDVSIPVDQFAADVTGTEHFDQLREHMTLNDQGVSPFRQEQHKEETAAYMRTILDEAQENVSEYVEAQEIFTSVRDQLVDSGAMNAQNASIMAQVVPAWATAQARRTGRTVAQVYEDSGLIIEGPQTGEMTRLQGEQVLSQSFNDFTGSYPLADFNDWWGDRTFEEQGGQFTEMTPDDYLSQVAPLDEQSEETQENVQDLVDHIESGRTLDPLVIYEDGKEDGRHRALAAKQLGYDTVPVIDYRGQQPFAQSQVETFKPTTASNFVESLTNASTAHTKGSSVAVFDESEYEAMDVFTLDDGMLGFAIESDGTLTGVFKHPDSKRKNALDTIVEAAIANGATKLDAFEGFLTESYARHGFVEKHRVRWNDEFKPKGWDTSTQGTPDVVYMELDNERREELHRQTNAQSVQEAFRLRQSGSGVQDSERGNRSRRSARGELEALEGAPQIRGATGPTQELVNVAEAYAESVGLTLEPQQEYAEVDVNRAERIAAEFEKMEHDPSDPAVKEAYDNLIKQTTAQYEALVEAGYEFYFVNENQDAEYLSTPWNAMRDIRENKRMGVYPTVRGFGSDTTFDVADNPLLADTGLTWDMHGESVPVLANDLFRAVHDAFGHGLEGAGFRADGEENAWVAHSKLFTGSALGALTTETRGQNSWLNYGPHGETNRTAKVEDTIFADQKIGLMPEWTWQEGVETFAQSQIDQTETEAFKKWSGGGEVVEPYDVNDHEFKADTPTVVKVFHGTTHEFSVFDALRGNLEGQFGAINYFTSSEQDASDNYAGEGPDLTGRIEQRAEQIAQDPEDFGIDPDLEMEAIEVEAKRIAREELSGGQEEVMELYVRVDNPFVIGENAQWIEFVDNDEIQSLAIEEVASNNDITVEEVNDNLDDYEDEIDEARWVVQEDQEHPLIEAIQTVSDRYDITPSELLGQVYELGESATPETIEDLLRTSEDYAYADSPDTGDLIGSQLVAEVIEEMGFDSIILKNAEDRFSTMNMEPGTAHVHIFDSGKTNIKSVDNQGTFDPADPDIFKQPTSPDVDGARGYYDPANSIIRLTEAADLSTFLHEFAHFMYEMELDNNTDMVQSINNWYKRNSKAVAAEANEYLGEKFDTVKQGVVKQLWEMTSAEYDKPPVLKSKEWFTVKVGGRSVDVIRNPTAQDIRVMIKELKESGKDSSVDPTLRFTYDQDGNEYRWAAIDAIHAHIEPVLIEREGVHLDQNADSRPPHRSVVRRALYEGHPVPDNVTSEYPGLVDEVSSIEGNKVFKQSPVDTEEARLQRAREQGFDTDTVLYHWTVAREKDGSELKSFIPSTRGKLGAGVYLTDNKPYGKKYADEKKGEPYVISTFIRGKIAELKDIEKAQDQSRSELQSTGELTTAKWKARTREILIESGFAGEHVGEEYVVFDPKNIRSVNAQFKDAGSDLLLAQNQPPAGKAGSITEEDVVAYLDNKTTGDKAKDSAIRRAVHEQFARGFETYLMEGKAPSIELRNAFRAFARWLAQIYQALRGDLKVKLDDEMRQVFDRLLATEEQIQAAQARARVEPFFTDATMAGMTDEEFADYQKRQEKVKDVQTETLRDKLIKELTRQTKTWWKEEKQDLIDEETDRLSKEQVYVARTRLKDGDIKLDHATVKEMIGEQKTDKLGRTSTRVPSTLNGMTAKGQKGVHPDEAAAFFGYSSGSEMLNDLTTTPPIKTVAETNAEARMIDKHGDILTDGTIEKQADEAVQNEERGKLILHELKVLARGTNQRTLERQAIKDVAVERIGKLSFREIHPGKYRKAEIRAAQESARMLAEGNREGAAQAKQRQVVNYYMGMAATEAKNNTMIIVDRMSRYNKKKVREEIQKAEGGYWEQIVKILERFEFRKSATLAQVDQINQDINTWAKERIEIDGDGLVLSNAVLNESYITHWKNVAYSDLQGISDSVKNIEHVARYANKLTRMGEEIEYNKLVDRWTTSMDEKVKTRFKSQRTDVIEGRKWGRWAMAQMTKIPFMASWLDGGDRVGISHQVLVQPLTEAYNDEIVMWGDVAKPVMEAIENRSKADMARHNRKIFIPEIQDENNDGNLMGHQVIAVALNTGNQSNLRKLLLGEGWADPENDADITLSNPKLQAVLKHMTKSDWEMVQLIWDRMELLYPQLAEVHRRTTGLVPPKVDATPVETEFGTFKGGYYPIKYDPNRSYRAKQFEDQLNAETESMFSNSTSIQASVNAGATNERTQFYAPIRLSLDVVPSHFQETIHYITHHDPVREINRLIRDQRVAKTITEKLGPEEFAQLKPWLNDVAKDGRTTPAKMSWDDIIGRLRFGVTLGAMGFKASTGIIQISGLSNTISEVGMANTMQGMRSVLGSVDDMKGAWEFASSNSKVMSHRAQTMDREIKNAMSRIEGKRGVLAAVQEASMKHIALIQTYMVDLPSWHAAYIKELSESGDETKAFQYADWVVENVQGSGATKDLAAIMRGQSETGRMFTMFMTFFSSLWNMERDIVKGAKSGAYSTTTTAAKVMFLFTLPVLFEMMMRGDLGADEDDDKSMSQKMLTGVALYPIQSIPFVRDVANAVGGDFGYNISPMQQIMEQGVRTIPTIVDRGFTDEEITKGQVKGATKFAGAALGIPGTSQAWATGEHLYDVIEEGEDLTLHQLLFGPEK